MDIEVNLQELYLGSSRSVKLRRQILCPACRGTGAKDGDVENCKKCDGKGFTLERRQVGPGFIQQVQVDCKKCKGVGKISKAECPVCEGKKVQTGDKDIEVYIEQGMPNGAEILFEGEGDQGCDDEDETTESSLGSSRCEPRLPSLHIPAEPEGSPPAVELFLSRPIGDAFVHPIRLIGEIHHLQEQAPLLGELVADASARCMWTTWYIGSPRPLSRSWPVAASTPRGLKGWAFRWP